MSASPETIAAKRVAVAIVTASRANDFETAEQLVEELSLVDRRRVIAILAGMLDAMLTVAHDHDDEAIARTLQAYALDEDND